MTTLCLYLQASTQAFGEDREPSFDYRGVFQAERFLLSGPKETYKETNELLLDWLHYYPQLQLNLSFPALLLEQIIEYQSSSDHFRKLAQHARTEVLAKVYRCPQSGGFSPEEFNSQVGKYLSVLRQALGMSAHVFHNKCLNFSNQMARELAVYDLEGVINSHSDVANNWRHPDFVYQSKDEQVKILIQNQALSDEMSKLLQQNNSEMAQGFLDNVQDSGDIINLVIDYEDLVEGADFFEEFLKLAEQDSELQFARAKEVLREREAVGELDAPSVWVGGVGKRIVSSAMHLFNWFN